MWWLLLIQLENEQYRASVIYPTEQTCEQNKTAEGDRCEAVSVQWAQRSLEPLECEKE